MNLKEIGEIRRRIRRDRSNMTALYGCYVNGQKQIISEFRQGIGTMPENEAEKYFGLLKRTLSGSVGKNLIDITFRTAQVASSPEHKLLMDLNKNKDKIVIVVTHNAAIAEVADRVLKISDGKIVSDVVQKSPKSIEDVEL